MLIDSDALIHYNRQTLHSLWCVRIEEKPRYIKKYIADLIRLFCT